MPGHVVNDVQEALIFFLRMWRMQHISHFQRLFPFHVEMSLDSFEMMKRFFFLPAVRVHVVGFSENFLLFCITLFVRG